MRTSARKLRGQRARRRNVASWSRRPAALSTACSRRETRPAAVARTLRRCCRPRVVSELSAAGLLLYRRDKDFKPRPRVDHRWIGPSVAGLSRRQALIHSAPSPRSGWKKTPAAAVIASGGQASPGDPTESVGGANLQLRGVRPPEACARLRQPGATSAKGIPRRSRCISQHCWRSLKQLGLSDHVVAVRARPRLPSPGRRCSRPMAR